MDLMCLVRTVRLTCPFALGVEAWPRAVRIFASLVAVAVFLTITGFAQDAQTPEPQPPTPDPKATFFDHSQTAKWWISGQANFVFQAHGDFYAQYSGPNSLKNYSEHATSRVLTLFTGYEFTPNTMAYLDVEESGGAASAARWDWLDSSTSTWCAIPRSALLPTSHG